MHDPDRGVRPDLQLALATAIPGATVHRDRRRSPRVREARASRIRCSTPASTSPIASISATTSSSLSRRPDHFFGPPAGALASAHDSGTLPCNIDVQRVGVARGERDVTDDHEEQCERGRVVHERRAGRQVSENGLYHFMIEPVISITTIAAPMNVAFSFWPGIELPELGGAPCGATTNARSSRVHRLSRPRSRRSSAPDRKNDRDQHRDREAAGPSTGGSLRTSSRRPTSVESGLDVQRRAGEQQDAEAASRCPVRDALDPIEPTELCIGAATLTMSARRRGRCCGRPNRRRRSRSSSQ